MSQPVPPHAFSHHWLAPGATRGLTLKQRHRLLSLTASSGVVANLEVAMRAAGCLPTCEAAAAAAATGSLESCQWLVQQGCLLADLQGARRALIAAAGGGHMHVCEWLLTLNPRCGMCAAEAAARGGHMDLMDWLLQRLRPAEPHEAAAAACAEFLAAAVAEGCDLPTLQRFWTQYRLETHASAGYEALLAAAGSPTPDWAAKVEWLEGQSRRWWRTEAPGELAGLRPDALERLTWLRGRGYPLQKRALAAAVSSGNVGAVVFLISEGVQPDESTAGLAIWGCHLPVLQALHAAGCRIDGLAACFMAAEAGRLQVVAWAVETLGATMSGGLIGHAAASGSVELMAWLRQRGCEWDAEAFRGAAEAGCEEALEWLAAQGCPVPEDGQPYLAACKNGDLATARCLRRLGLPWGDPDALVSAVVRGGARPPMLRWLLKARCPVDVAAVEAMLAASQPGRFAEALALMRQHLQQQQGQGRGQQQQQQHGEQPQQQAP